ncbi:MAG: DUF1501 domain-containing protein [Planctomycetaceae bacterium]
MSLSRREFLVSSAVLAGAGLPGVFRRAALAAPKPDQPGGGETILVVVQLTGGNDGLNTVVPFRDPAYAAARPTLKQPPSQVKKINDDLAFHPAMQGLSELLESSQLAIVQGIGYTDPNRSHFVSMDIWHKATPSKEEPYGWLGRARSPLGGAGRLMHVGEGEGPLALFGPTGHAPSLSSLEQYQLRVGPGGEEKRSLIHHLAETNTASGNELLALVRQSTQETYASAERLSRVAGNYQPTASYPQTRLAERLKLVAQLIDADVPERIYYTTHDGFDTHASQAETHARLLGELSDALAAFQKDVAGHGHAKRVLVLTFSEFGRRVDENGSQGTDHGAASQMFLIGERVKPGPIGEHPSLTDLGEGDLKHHTDFRSVYATVLDDWLGVSSEAVLGQRYPRLELLA